MNTIAEFIKQKRKEIGLTQEEFAIRSGLGLRFVRELEQGKETVRMDKVNQALSMFGMKAVPGRKDDWWKHTEQRMYMYGKPLQEHWKKQITDIHLYKEQLALTANGKKQNLRRKDFLILAETIGIPPKSAEKMIDKIIKLKDRYVQLCKTSYLPDDMKGALEELIAQRIEALMK